MRGVGNEAQIGLMIFIQGGWHADNNGIHLSELRVVGGGRKAVFLSRLNLLRRDAVDVGTALGQRINFARVDIEAGHLEFLLAVQQSQRKPDVTQADDADAGLVLLNSGLELINRRICGGVGRHEFFRGESKMGSMKTFKF